MNDELPTQPLKDWETPTLVCTGTVAELLQTQTPCTQNCGGDD